MNVPFRMIADIETTLMGLISNEKEKQEMHVYVKQRASGGNNVQKAILAQRSKSRSQG